MAKDVKELRDDCDQCYEERIGMKRCSECGAMVKRKKKEKVNHLCVPQDKDTTHIKDCTNENCPRL